MNRKINEHKLWFREHKPVTSQQTADYLASMGSGFNQEKNEEYEKLVKKYPKALFPLAIGLSLQWGGYVVDDEEFYSGLVAYFTAGNSTILSNTDNYVHRHGDALNDAIISWNKLIKATKTNLSTDFSLNELIEYQREIWNVFEQYKTVADRLKHLGVWLLLAPFKIVAIMRMDLWKDMDIDKIMMPLGGQVDKGLAYIEKQGVEEVSGWQTRTKFNDVNSNLAEVERAQAIQTQLASLAHSKVLHINSGLHLLG